MTLDQMIAQREALLSSRFRGVRTVEIEGKRVTYPRLRRSSQPRQRQPAGRCRETFRLAVLAPIDCANAEGRDLAAAQLAGFQARRKDAIARVLEAAAGNPGQPAAR